MQCVCMHLHTCTLAHTSVYKRHKHTIHMHTPYVPLQTHMHNTYMLTSIHAHTLYRCMCICTCTYTDPCTHTQRYTLLHIQMYTDTHIQSMCMYTDMCMVHIYIFTHVCTHTCSSGQAGPPWGTVSTQSEYCRTQHSFSDHCSLHKKTPSQVQAFFHDLHATSI